MVAMIEKLKIDGNFKMPDIVFDPENNYYEISGNSIPENAAKAYEPIYNWIDQNVPEIEEAMKFIFKINHMNSSSVRAMLQLIGRLDRCYQQGSKITIEWHFDVDDDRDMGSTYESSTDIPFSFVKME